MFSKVYIRIHGILTPNTTLLMYYFAQLMTEQLVTNHLQKLCRLLLSYLILKRFAILNTNSYFLYWTLAARRYTIFATNKIIEIRDIDNHVLYASVAHCKRIFLLGLCNGQICFCNVAYQAVANFNLTSEIIYWFCMTWGHVAYVLAECIHCTV